MFSIRFILDFHSPHSFSSQTNKHAIFFSSSSFQWQEYFNNHDNYYFTTIMSRKYTQLTHTSNLQCYTQISVKLTSMCSNTVIFRHIVQNIITDNSAASKNVTSINTLNTQLHVSTENLSATVSILSQKRTQRVTLYLIIYNIPLPWDKILLTHYVTYILCNVDIV